MTSTSKLKNRYHPLVAILVFFTVWKKGRQMDETGARMTEKGGRREGKRLQMVVFEGVIVMWKTGC